MRIAYIIESLPAFIVNEVMELRRQGHEVTLLSAFRTVTERDPYKESLRRECLYFPPGYDGVVADNLRALATGPRPYLKVANELVRQRESLRFLVLGAHLARRADQCGVRHVHGTFGTRTTTLAFVVARLLGVGFSFTTHAYDIFRPNPSLEWKTREAEFMRTISAFGRRHVADTYRGVDLAKVDVIHLGVDTTGLRPVVPRVSPEPGLLVLSVGNLIPQKGHVHLLEALAAARALGAPLRCDIVGEGPERPRLEALVARLGLGGVVRLLGDRPVAEVHQMLGRADIFALPCLDLRGRPDAHVDGIPVAIMEAMATGLPVVSSPVGGIPELVEDGVTGISVVAGDSAGLGLELRRLCDDPALRARLGAAGRARIERDFDLATNTRRLADRLARAGA